MPQLRLFFPKTWYIFSHNYTKKYLNIRREIIFFLIQKYWSTSFLIKFNKIFIKNIPLKIFNIKIQYRIKSHLPYSSNIYARVKWIKWAKKFEISSI